MAVVFISPKQRQKTFFMAITFIFVLFLALISVGIFSAKPKQVLPALVFNRPKVNIDMTIFDSDQFKNLETFSQMQTQYSYKAVNEANEPKTGFISATSIEEARQILTGMNLTVSEITEAEIGRDNPFIPYYQASPVKTTKK